MIHWQLQGYIHNEYDDEEEELDDYDDDDNFTNFVETITLGNRAARQPVYEVWTGQVCLRCQ